MIDFPYRRLETDGRTYPLIPIELKRRDRILPFLCLIDSGANVSLFHADVADLLGITLRTGVEQELHGIGGVIRGRLHQVNCALVHPTDEGVTKYPFKCRIVFSRDIQVPFQIVGRLDFFQSFTVTFDENEQKIYLDPHIPSALSEQN